MSENDKLVLIYATFPSAAEAERIGGHLVDQGLIACVNIFPGMTAIYVWEGKRQVRDYSYSRGVLSYAVPASASGDGTIAYSVWRRVAP